MLPDRVSNPGPLTYESGVLPIALRGPALGKGTSRKNEKTEKALIISKDIVRNLIRISSSRNTYLIRISSSRKTYMDTPTGFSAVLRRETHWNLLVEKNVYGYAFRFLRGFTTGNSLESPRREKRIWIRLQVPPRFYDGKLIRISSSRKTYRIRLQVSPRFYDGKQLYSERSKFFFIFNPY